MPMAANPVYRDLYTGDTGPIQRDLDAAAILDAEITELSRAALAQGVDVFASCEEYEAEKFWRIRKTFIELAKLRQIRDCISAPPTPPAAPAATAKTRRRKAG